MKIYACEKCGSVDLFLKENGNQKGLYCGDCGKWIKWVSKKELPLVERFIESNRTPNKKIGNQIDAAMIESLAVSISKLSKKYGFMEVAKAIYEVTDLGITSEILEKFSELEGEV